MNKAAFTIVQNDMVMLKLWLRYYKKFFDKLYVLGNDTKQSHDGDIAALSREIPFEFERIPYVNNSDASAEVVKNKQKALLAEYEWVLYTDCDEIVVCDIKRYYNFDHLADTTDKDIVYCEGYNLLQAEDEAPIDYTKPYFKQRKYWSKDVDYNKPLFARVPINWAPGCHRELETEDTVGKVLTNTGLFLVHLKYADLNADMGNRDRGPIITEIQHAKVTEGMEQKRDVPVYIRYIL